MNNILTIENLTFGYTKSKLIYDNFSLSLKENELISIVGESGSGKSTLFELITNNLKPLGGIIKSGKISTIYQDPYTSFHPSYKIIDQLRDVVDDFSDLKKYCNNLSLAYNILEYRPQELSGGQLQRCSILRAVLMKPEIILADEPTSALDNIIALQTMQLLVRFLDKLSILLITHDKDLALWCSNKIINLNDN